MKPKYLGEHNSLSKSFSLDRISRKESRKDFNKAIQVIEKNKKKMNYEEVSATKNIVKVSLIGVGMRSHAGIAGQMFTCLAKKKINIRMISTSEIKISVVIDQKNLENAVKALHNEFKLERK